MGEYYPPKVVIPIYAVFTAIGIALTGLRLWMRVSYSRSRPGVDDWLIVVGVAIVTCCTCIQFYNALHGTGGEALSPGAAAHQAIVSHKVDFTMIVIEKPAFGAIKLSLLFFYRRIFGVWPGFRKINIALMVLIVLWTLSFALADIFLCGSAIGLNFAVDQTESQQKCGDKGLLLLLFAATSVVTDVLVLGLPFFFMRKLQMPSKKKWAASGVFLLGFIATFAGILRTIFLAIAYPMGRLHWDYEAPADGKTPLVLQVFNPTFWVMMEMLLGAWAANLPPLGPMMRTMHIGSTFGSVYRKFSSAYSSSGHSSERKESTWHSQSTERIHHSNDVERAVPLGNIESTSSRESMYPY